MCTDLSCYGYMLLLSRDKTDFVVEYEGNLSALLHCLEQLWVLG